MHLFLLLISKSRSRRQNNLGPLAWWGVCINCQQRSQQTDLRKLLEGQSQYFRMLLWEEDKFWMLFLLPNIFINCWQRSLDVLLLRTGLLTQEPKVGSLESCARWTVRRPYIQQSLPMHHLIAYLLPFR